MRLSATLSTAAPRLLRHREVLFYATLVLMVLPIWLVDYPPMVDLPQHAAQINTLKHYLAGNRFALEHYELALFTPYSLSYLLSLGLSYLMPLIVAIKLVTSCAMIATPLLAGRIYRTLGYDDFFKWLIIPSSFGFIFYFGFYSFLVATPLGLALILATLHFEKRPTFLSAAGIVALGCLLFFSHIIVLGYAALISLSYLAVQRVSQPGKLLLLAIPYTAPLPLIASWLAGTFEREAQARSKVSFDDLDDRLKTFAESISGNPGQEWIGVLVLLTILASPWLLSAQRASSPALKTPLLVTAALMLLFPKYFMGTAYLYHRFFSFTLICAGMLMTVKSDALKPKALLLPAVVILFCLGNLMSFQRYQQDANDFNQLVALLPAEQTVLSLIEDRRHSALADFPVFLHYPSWYQAQQVGHVDFNFASFFPQMMRFPNQQVPAIGFGLEWHPERFDWQQHDGAQYDYFMLRSQHQGLAEQFYRQYGEHVILAGQQGRWWLYKRRRPNR